MTHSVLERRPIVRDIERRLFLRQALSVGALTMLAGLRACIKIICWRIVAVIMLGGRRISSGAP